ncbi:PKD domain-containing protein [Capillimicrobium parvum]|uniref:PKD domain-containing protein n=1 Tax=Capillimicrobium parvum TaxID=2884022 RepID=UPI00216AD1F4|nr:PKD domain-containing protein [Capillimicrobium parvum]
MRRCLALSGLCAALLLLPAAAAPAAWFPGEVIDGPNPGLVSVGGVDIAQKDGTGGVVYLRLDGGAPHVFVARLLDGAWQPPERIDNGIAEGASAPVIAAGPGGRLVVAWVSGGSLISSVRPDSATGWTTPQGVAFPAEAPAIDMGLNGHTYVTWSASGDVRAAYMGRGLTQFQVIPTSLDMEPARQAGDAEGRRPAVAVSAEGLALAAWGEVFADGSQHVIARRVNGLSLSPIPQDVTLGDLDGRPGGNADSPDVAMSADSSFGWIAFRQTFFDGGAPMTRAVARRMRGSQFEAARPIDGQGFPAEDVGAPRIAENVGGAGLTAAGRLSGQIFGSTFFEERYDEVIFSGAVPLTSSPSPFSRRPVIAFAEDKTGLVAWTAPDASLRVRERAGEWQPEQLLSKPEFGPVDVNAGVSASGDRYLDAAVVAIQDTGAERRLTAAMLDRDPGSFSPASSSTWYKEVPSRISWREPINIWGPLTYRVYIDDRLAGETRQLSYPLTQLGLRPGQHLYRIEAVDVRGQVSSTPTRLIRFDAQPPRVSISFSGTRRAGRITTVNVTATDSGGIKGRPRVSFGDGSSVRGRSVEHRFRKGTWTVTVRVSDQAGNVTVRSRSVRIR